MKRLPIPLLALTLYFVLFYWFLAWILPEYKVNVNASFASGAWKVSLAIAFALVLILIFLPDKNGLRKSDRLCAKDLPLVFLPLIPVIQYVANNQDILSRLGSLYIFGVFLGFSALFVIILPLLLSRVSSAKILMITGLAFTFTITNMAAVTAKFSWFEHGNLAIQLALLATAFLVIWILHCHIGRKFMYFILGVYLVGSCVMQPQPFIHLANNINTGVRLSYQDNKLLNLVGSSMPVSTPNIYLLIYDAYVANETMLGYGIDNSAQEEYLKSLGFKLYPRTYSLGSASAGTMSRVLNASTEYYGFAKRGTSGDGVVQNLLKGFGYETYGVFHCDYFYQGIGSSYDVSFPEATPSAHWLLTKAIFMGEFRFEAGYTKPPHEQFVDYKLHLFSNVSSKPRFIYMHTSIPGHSQNSGTLRPNETELYLARLSRANQEMEQDLETILKNDPKSIIVVAGDHGPYLTKNGTGTGGHYALSEIARLDIQDRFGTFLAIRWASNDYSKYDNITVIQDLFPAIFAYMFEDDKMLAAKVESTTTSKNKISGAIVKDGIIYGGVNDNESLFEGAK